MIKSTEGFRLPQSASEEMAVNYLQKSKFRGVCWLKLTRLSLSSPSVRLHLCANQPYSLSLFSSGIVTLMFSFTTITSVFLGYGLNIALLVIPVSTLIAFAQLRGTMPGAPDGTGECELLIPNCCYSAVICQAPWSVSPMSESLKNSDNRSKDYVGILPCFAITSLSVSQYCTQLDRYDCSFAI
jgi:hypothetical protein